MQSTNMLLQSVYLDNLGTNKLHESADDKETWKQKTDEVLRGRCSLDSAFFYQHHDHHQKPCYGFVDGLS